MTLRRLLTITMMFSALLAAVPGQETRTQKSTGVSITLPSGWSWQSKIGDGIAVQLEVEVKGRKEVAKATLYTSPGRFVGARIDEITGDIEQNPKGYSSLKVKEKQRFAKQRNVVFISYVKKRGSEYDRDYNRRHWLWRRNGLLFEWREEVRKEAAGQASSGFSAAQRSLKFGKAAGQKTRDKERDYVNQRVKYKIPADWEWTRGKEGAKVRLPTGHHVFFNANTETIVKGQRWQMGIGLQGQKTGATVRQVVQANQHRMREGWDEVEGFEVKDKVPFQGEKATLISFTGINKRISDKERFFSHWYAFKHKGTVFLWNELGPQRAKKSAQKLLKKARGGLRTY